MREENLPDGSTVLLSAAIMGLAEFIVMVIFYRQALGLCWQALGETALQNLLVHNPIIFYSLQHLQKSYIRNHRGKKSFAKRRLALLLQRKHLEFVL